MAQKVQVLLIDDLDGGDADETVSFALDGTQYEIDLSEKNARRLRESLAGFVPHARRIGGRARPAATKTRHRPAEAPKNGAHEKEITPKAIRAWAAENGIQVSDRGRIPVDLQTRFQAAQG